MNLPEHRQIRSGRTHSTPWEPSGYGAAIERHRPRLNGWDVAGWIGSVVLVLLTFLMVYAPGLIECFGGVAKP